MADGTVSEPQLLRRARQVVRDYRQANAARAAREAEAAARLKAVDEQFKVTKGQIMAQFAQVRDVVDGARTELGSVDLNWLLTGDYSPLADSSSSGSAGALQVDRARSLADEIRPTVADIRRIRAGMGGTRLGGVTALVWWDFIIAGGSLIGMFAEFSRTGYDPAAGLFGTLLLLSTAAFGTGGVGLLIGKPWSRYYNWGLHVLIGLFGITTIIQPIVSLIIALYLGLSSNVKRYFGAGLNARVTHAESLARELREMLTSARAWLGRQLAVAEAEYGRKREETIEANRQALAQATLAYDRSVADLRQAIQGINEEAGFGAAPWPDADWSGWVPAGEDGAPPPTLRFGSITSVGGVANPSYPPLLSGSRDSLQLSAFLPFLPGQRPVLVEATGPAKAVAATAIQALLIRLLATLPPGDLRFTFVDPVGLGQNVAPLMALADSDEALIGGKAWTEPQHIEQRLAALTEHMENVIQKYLRNEYPSIEDYNQQVGVVAEPYRVLVVMDFPANFSEAAARRLVSIATNGPRCGVYALVLHDTAQPSPYGFNVADLQRASTVVTSDGQRFAWQDDDFRECDLTLDALPDPGFIQRLLKTIGEAAVLASRVEVPFARIAPPEAEWWHGVTTEGLRAPLGPKGAHKVQELDLGQGTAQHALVVGKTGSGKSTLLHTLITALALLDPPEELQLYLIDFKKGVEFKTYAEHELPHARVIAIESEREFGLSALQGLDVELKQRGDLFRHTGVDGLAPYREKTGERLPRILLLVDEFQEFFTEDDAIAAQAAQILDRLVRQGRAFGIHVLLGSQTLAGAYALARSTIDQMAVRIALQCSEADSRLILADDNPAARLLSRPGEAIYNAANGTVEGNNIFQVAWLPDEQRDEYLRRLHEMARRQHYRSPQPQIVFEGNAPADLSANRQLLDLIGAPAWSAPQRAVRAWLGEPIAIRESVAATFRRQSGSNLLIVGQDDEAALGMMAMALVSLAAQCAPTTANGARAGATSFCVLDFGAVDAPYAEFFTQLQGYLPHPLVVGRRRELPAILGQLALEVQRRVDAGDDATGADDATGPIYLFVFGLQRARDLREDDGIESFGGRSAAPNPAQQFATLVREGPDVGVHTIVWCDTVTNLNRSLDRRAQREFAMRVAFQMSAEDSASLLDTPVASKLGPHRALFSSEDEGRLEKFRPYALPSQHWLADAGSALRGKRMEVQP